MQVTIVPAVPLKPTFKPFVIEVRVESLEEAIAVRALHYGMSEGTLAEIVQGACIRPPRREHLLKVTRGLGVAVDVELEAQGV